MNDARTASDVLARAFEDADRDAAAAAGYSEDDLALKFTEKHRATWRYVAGRGRWLRWNGRVWCVDETLEHFDLARKVCRAAAEEVLSTSTSKNRERIAAILESARTVAAVVKLSSADRAHAMSIDEWDSDYWELNTPFGIVDLKTGLIEAHRPDAYCTKMTAVAPGGPCPLWHRVLQETFQGDRRRIAHLQRFAGYCLTGETREHVFLFFHGLGANGKSTILNTLAGVMGDYAQAAAFSTFLESKGEQHPSDLALLRGARLVYSQEVEDGRRWATARIKALSAADPITARFMRQDFFTFTPTFKLLLAGNHKPALRNVDEAMRRRLHLVPFTYCVPPADRDQHLMEKLRKEWGGILAWAIRGCLRWQRLGLRPPAAVREATEAYLQDEDVLEAWLGECVLREAKAFTSSKDLHTSYQAWAERAGERFYGAKRLGQLIEDRGFQRVRTGRANGFRGLKLVSSTDQMELVA